MLQQLTREKLQALVKHPSFNSVVINDQKIIHSHNNGEPTFYVKVSIHARGLDVFNLLAEMVPELKVEKIRPFQTEHTDSFSFGSIADGKLEEATVDIWANLGKMPKERTPASTGAIEEINQSNYITESEVVANA